MKKGAANLFSAIKVGSVPWKNRMVVSAMTRCRADPKTGIPTDLHAEYYSQRANAGMVLTECTQISPDSSAFPGSTGIHSQEQVEGWKKVTDAVHKKGSNLYLQIWHGGRANPKEFSGIQPIAPSAIAINGTYYSYKTNAMEKHTVPREMTKDEIKKMRENFKKGAENAKKAGFAGVQLHGASGYIIHEFISSNTNKRTDEYGGSVENRCKFPLQVLDDLIDVFGKDKVGIKVSPTFAYNDMKDEDPVKNYGYFIKELDKRGISFIEYIEEKDNGLVPGGSLKTFRPYYKGVVIGNNNFDFESGNKAIESGNADAISFARLYLANPDLKERFEKKAPLNKPDPTTFYAGGPKGYTDYPFLKK